MNNGELTHTHLTYKKNDPLSYILFTVNWLSA